MPKMILPVSKSLYFLYTKNMYIACFIKGHTHAGTFLIGKWNYLVCLL